MNMRSAVIFDFDGVIVDSYDCFLACWTRACEGESLAHLSAPERFLRLFETNFRVGIDGLGLGEPRTNGLLSRFLGELSNGFNPRGFQPGIEDCIERLSRSHELHVVTSSATDVVRGYLERGGVKAFRSVLGLDVEPSKVVKIRRIMSGYDREKCFYVGDTLGDMLEAREAGARPVAAAWGWHSPETLMRGRPDHIAASPAVLLELLTGAGADA